MVRKEKENGKEVIDIFAELGDALGDAPGHPQPDGAPDPDPTFTVTTTTPQLVPAGHSGDLSGDVGVDPVQDRIRALEEQLKAALAARDTGTTPAVIPAVPQDVPERPVNPDAILIHFVENGFTALGSVWYRGQEIEFPAGSSNYVDTLDRHGRSWLDLRFDENAQIEKFGLVMFKDGPWRGKSYTDADLRLQQPLKALRDGEKPPLPPTQDELHQAAATERRRMRRPPRVDA